MSMRGIDRKKHLIIGLFCEASLNYNIWNHIGGVAGMEDVKALHFKDKIAGGDGKLCSSWPGDVCVFGQNGETRLLPKKIRTDAKPFFSPERCLYCVDKLNQFADVSVGDNYTKRNAPRMGSSSVIVRTEAGMVVKNETLFDIFPESLEEISHSQSLSEKEENLCYQHFCGAQSLIRNDEFPKPRDVEKSRPKYETALRELAMGAVGDFSGINEAIKRKAIEKKRRKSLIYKILHFFHLEQ
jgi:coenzyme F420-reducing hydrogenase beta subunit